MIPTNRFGHSSLERGLVSASLMVKRASGSKVLNPLVCVADAGTNSESKILR